VAPAGAQGRFRVWLFSHFGPRTVGFAADDGETYYRTCLVLTRLAAIPAA